MIILQNILIALDYLPCTLWIQNLLAETEDNIFINLNSNDLNKLNNTTLIVKYFLTQSYWVYFLLQPLRNKELKPVSSQSHHTGFVIPTHTHPRNYITEIILPYIRMKRMNPFFCCDT